jgi:hypothetical protein
LRPLTDPRAMEIVRRSPAGHQRKRRDPALLVQSILEAAA